MSTLLILFGQTKTEATIVIISLVLVAAIIGYIVSWLYCKSVYEKSIKLLESERDEMKRTIVNLNADKNNLQKILHDRDTEIEQLKKGG